jgi:hypothetical protein
MMKQHLAGLEFELNPLPVGEIDPDLLSTR